MINMRLQESRCQEPNKYDVNNLRCLLIVIAQDVFLY